MLTALSSEISRCVALETGADDYLTKPASPREVVSRINRLLRTNPRRTPGTQFHVKDLFIDVPNQLVTVNGSRIELSQREFELLSFLAQTIFRRQEAASRISLARNSLDL
jgi:DNA-binding response OmpR family regulator